MVTIRISDQTILNNTHLYKTHREFIASVLKKQSLSVTRWTHEYGVLGSIKKWGLVYTRSDSEIDPAMEIHGIVGENIERIEIQ